MFKKSVRFSFLIVLTAMFILSLGYSIYKTEVNQPWAYFNTFARVWEFSLGGIVALIISRIPMKKLLALFWDGLV